VSKAQGSFVVSKTDVVKEKQKFCGNLHVISRRSSFSPVLLIIISVCGAT
jgi:hypothetical protein